MCFSDLPAKRPAGGFAVRFPYAYFLFAILFLTTIHSPLATILYAADPGIEFGAADDLSVMGVEGGSADPDVEIKGFTVFGSTQASYTGAVTGPGNVVVNGYLSVSSGAYFAAVSTFTVISVGSMTTAGAGVIFSTNAYFMNGNVGIGTASPGARLEVAGQVKITGGSPGAGKVLSSDASGLATWAIAASTHAIGDNYGGGIIFWLDASGKHGLIAATADQSSAIQWWSGSLLTGATFDGVYAGKANTAKIIAAQGAGSYAAQLCNGYSVTANNEYYDDWYLPSKYELGLLYSQKSVVGGFAGSTYWSSTEAGVSWAWLENFGTGNVVDGNKTATIYVRCVRAIGAPQSDLGDNLGNHTATQILNMAGKDIVGVSTITVSSITTVSAGVTFSTNVFVMNGNVGIGTTSPAAKLDVAGGIKLANDTAACTSSNVGTLRWTGGQLQLCANNSWRTIRVNLINATGGTITDIGGYRVHTFTSNGTFTPDGTGDVEVLVVAGGGSGGTNGGGGGAGGLTYNPSYAVTAGPITVTVGAGGTGGVYPTAGTNGGNSVFGSITVIGGGRGGSQGVGQNGGSGGGGGYENFAGGTGTAGQGNNGAAATGGATGNYGGGGGAGAEASGMNGGNGLPSAISGALVSYAGGGGGGRQSGSPAGSGGVGGGGNGNTLEQAAFSAIANTGGGGGGSAGGSGISGNGGSGIVVVRYPL